MRNASSYERDASSASHRDPHHVRHLHHNSQGGSFAHISTQTSGLSSPASSPSSSSWSSSSSSSPFFFRPGLQCCRLSLPMLPKRCLRLGLFACLLVSSVLVYVTLFRHPPPEQLLKMNSGKKDFNLRAVFGQVDSWDGRNGPLVPSASGSRDLRHSRGDNVPVEIEEEEEEEKEEDVDKDGGGHRREDDASFWARLEKGDKNDDPADEAGEGQAAGKGGNKPASRGGHQPEPPGDASEQKNKKKKVAAAAEEEVEEEEEEGKEDEGEEKRSRGQGESLVGKAAWDKFIVDNHHTVVGIVLDKCDRPQQQLGTVIMLPDAENGGVKTRTYYNFTLQEDLSEGTFSIEIKYNGQGLYDNYWDICQMEEDLEPANRTFLCPIRRGRQHLVKEKHVPNYLPKGRYQSKAWVKDAKERLLVCGFSDFVL